MFNTIPCCTPLLLARPNPRISNLPNSFFLPAMAAILVVPISSPTIMGCSLFMLFVFLLPHLFVLTMRKVLLYYVVLLLFLFHFFNNHFLLASLPLAPLFPVYPVSFQQALQHG